MTDVISPHCEACDGVLECPERFLPCALDLCFRNCFCHFHGSQRMDVKRLSNLVRCTGLDMVRQLSAQSCTYASLQNETTMTFDDSPSGWTVWWSAWPSVVWDLIWIVLVLYGTWRVGSRELRIGDWCPLFANVGVLEQVTESDVWNRALAVPSKRQNPHDIAGSLSRKEENQ